MRQSSNNWWSDREQEAPELVDGGAPVSFLLGQLSNFLVVEEAPLAAVKVPKRLLRIHPDEQIARIVASIREFGFVFPIMIDAANEIVAGVGRYLAAEKLQLTRVPIIRLAHLEPSQVRALRLADNKLAEGSKWDDPAVAIELKELCLELEHKIDLTGFNTAEIDLRIGSLDGASRPDPVDEEVPKPLHPTSCLGDVWQLGRHQLLCSNALKSEAYEAIMGTEVARLVFTDPPYNTPINGHVSGLGRVRHREFAMASGELSEEGFIQFLATSLRSMAAHLEDGGLAFVCMDWRHLYELFVAQRQIGFTFLNLCIWSKTNAGMGSFYRSAHEEVAVFKKGTAAHINNIRLGRFGRYRTNVWSYAGANTFRKGRDEDLAAHPTVKPVSLVADAILDASRRGHIVLDPFAGSGTTILAAERTGRRARAIEIDPGYVDVCLTRWQRMTGQEPTHLATGQRFSEVAKIRSGTLERPSSADLDGAQVRQRVRTTPVMVES
jgi:DNA modification methylase